MKVDRTKLMEDIGVLTNAPHSTDSPGFSFVQLDDGTSVYCPRDVTKAARATALDIGEKVRVRYQKLAGNRFVATRAHVLREPSPANADDQALVALFVQIDDRLDEIDDAMLAIYAILEGRGCDLPETVGD